MKKLAALLLLFATTAQAETLYKVVGPDGKITYTDRPPADAKSTTALKFADGPTSPLPDSVLKYQAALQKSMQNRLIEAQKIDTAGSVVLFGAKWCGYCTKAKAYLAARNVNYREYDIDTEEGGKAFFLSGGQGGGIPLLMADGKQVRGFTAGSYDSFFSAKK